MVSWWPGDGNANDIQDGNNGTLQNGATFTAGMVGQAFHFDRTASQFVQTTDAANLSFERTNAFTIDAWIRTSETVHNLFIATKQENSTPFRGYGLAISNGEVPACEGSSNPAAAGAGQLVGFLDGATSITCPPDHYISVRGATHLNDGQWHHVAMTYDGSSAAAGVKLYVDGAAEASVVQQDNLGSNTILNTVPFTIGSRESGGVPFNGDIDEVEVFNRVLSPAEIQAIFMAGSAGKCKPGRLLVLRDERNGNRLCVNPSTGAYTFRTGSNATFTGTVVFRTGAYLFFTSRPREVNRLFGLVDMTRTRRGQAALQVGRTPFTIRDLDISNSGPCN
jgi:hypothetical protein